MIIEKLELSPFGTNCYIVGDESTKEGMIIDPGAEASRILSRVKDLGLNIRYVALTHAHIDHIGALKEVVDATGAEFAVHTEDAKALETSSQSSMSPFFSGPSPPPSPDRLLNGGDSIDIGNLHFLVLHTPGHSLGCICLLGDGIVFSGDTLFNFGIGRTDFPGGSYRQILDSIHTKLMILPDNTIVCPGHGPDTTIGTERRGNPFLRG